MVVGHRFEASPVLCVAVEQYLIRMDGLARCEISEPPPHPDLVALIDSRVALDCLHQGACFTLFGGAALAEAAAGEPRPQLVNIMGFPSEIVSGVVVGVERQIGVDPIEARNHAGEGADVPAETRDRIP